jgi:hypothetical protein
MPYKDEATRRKANQACHIRRKAKKLAQRPLAIDEFPVHPAVKMAKNQLLVAFRLGTLVQYGKAHRELKRLLAIHHPVEGRPAEQFCDHATFEKLKR